MEPSARGILRTTAERASVVEEEDLRRCGRDLAADGERGGGRAAPGGQAAQAYPSGGTPNPRPSICADQFGGVERIDGDSKPRTALKLYFPRKFNHGLKIQTLLSLFLLKLSVKKNFGTGGTCTCREKKLADLQQGRVKKS